MAKVSVRDRVWLQRTLAIMDQRTAIYRAERRYDPADRGGSTSVRRLIRSPHSSGGLA